MKKVIIAFVALIAFASCGNNTASKNNDNSATVTKSEVGCDNDCANCATPCSKKSETGVVEVLYMHGKQRCVTCIAIGTEAEEVVGDMTNDKVIMKTIDFSTPEGEKIADKYEIASSSLILVKDGKVENVTAMSFQYAKNNPDQFKKNLKESIQNMLN